jgi:hypothetical protein
MAHPDVLVYIQTVKTYLDKNSEAKEYFIGDNSEESFYELVIDVASVNYEKRGEPQLTKEQFELIRITLRAFKQAEEEEVEDTSIYEYIPKHINFYLK